jgi:uncharacterized membrane protein
MTIDPTTFAAIAAMAVATYLTRIAGYWLVRRVSLTGRPAAALEAVPGAVLIALIAPTVLATGPAESGAALVTILIARRGAMLPAVVGGVAAVALFRLMLA